MMLLLRSLFSHFSCWCGHPCHVEMHKTAYIEWLEFKVRQKEKYFSSKRSLLTILMHHALFTLKQGIQPQEGELFVETESFKSSENYPNPSKHFHYLFIK